MRNKYILYRHTSILLTLILLLSFIQYPALNVNAADDHSITLQTGSNSLNLGTVYAGDSLSFTVDYSDLLLIETVTDINLDPLTTDTFAGLTSSGGNKYTFTVNTEPTSAGAAFGDSPVYGTNTFSRKFFATSLDGDYEIASVTVTYEIKKKDCNCSVTCGNTTYGTPISPAFSNGGSDGSASVILKNDSGDVFYNGNYDEFVSGISNEILNAGNYTLIYNINESAQYLEGNDSCTFTIDPVHPTFKINDAEQGKKLVRKISFPTNDGIDYNGDNDYDTDYFRVLYKPDTTDASYSEEEPTAPGKYKALLDMANNDNYYDAECEFSIIKTKKDGKGSVKVEDTVYGESSVKPKLESETNGTDNVLIYYKLKESDDSTYTKEVPVKPGSYTCKAEFAEKGNYDKFTATCNFKIDKGKGVGTLTVGNTYVGAGLKTEPVSKTNGITAVTYMYKKKGESDNAYTTTVPTKEGEYVVKAVFGMTDYYYAAEVIAYFKLQYLPAPGFEMVGTKGQNGYYTSDVNIKAPNGYSVATVFLGDYKNSVKIDENTEYVYFKHNATGALSDKVKISSFKIDKTAPTFKDTALINIINKNAVYQDSYSLTITDDNLESVYVNKTDKQTVKNGSCCINFTAGKEATEYEIKATDKAGHVSTYSFTLSPEWMNDMIIPVGEPVMLTPGTKYNLDNGKWKINNDSMTYNGGNSFYVTDECEYTFKKED